jgi:hypothetical protein
MRKRWEYWERRMGILGREEEKIVRWEKGWDEVEEE